MEHVLAFLRDGTVIIATLGYAGVFSVMLVEGSGIPLPFPGPLLLAFVGYTAWSGRIGFVEATLAAAAGSTTGAWLLYRVARDAGPHLMTRYADRFRLTSQKLERAESWFATHAGRATFFARVTPGVRIYISIAAGLARMHQAVFLVSTFAGTWLWAVAFMGAAWVLGEGWRMVADLIGIIQSWILLVAGLVVMVVIAYSRGKGEHQARS